MALGLSFNRKQSLIFHIRSTNDVIVVKTNNHSYTRTYMFMPRDVDVWRTTNCPPEVRQLCEKKYGPTILDEGPPE